MRQLVILVNSHFRKPLLWEIVLWQNVTSAQCLPTNIFRKRGKSGKSPQLCFQANCCWNCFERCEAEISWEWFITDFLQDYQRTFVKSNRPHVKIKNQFVFSLLYKIIDRGWIQTQNLPKGKRKDGPLNFDWKQVSVLVFGCDHV